MREFLIFVIFVITNLIAWLNYSAQTADVYPRWLMYTNQAFGVACMAIIGVLLIRCGR